MSNYKDISFEGKKYITIKSNGGASDCDKCCFRNEMKNCIKANEFLSCEIHSVYFAPSNNENKVADLDKQKAGTKYDQDKLQYSLIPPYALEQVAKNLTVGLKKYKERDNWKKVEGAEQRYLDALYRHLEAHRRGELYDVDSSVPDMPHMAAVAVNAMFLLEFMLDPNLKKQEE